MKNFKFLVFLSIFLIVNFAFAAKREKRVRDEVNVGNETSENPAENLAKIRAILPSEEIELLIEECKKPHPRLKLINQLLRNPFLINRRGNQGYSAFHAAAEAGEIKTLQYLLDSGADLYALDTLGRSALSIALTRLHFKAAKLLIDAERLQQEQKPYPENIFDPNSPISIVAASGDLSNILHLLELGVPLSTEFLSIPSLWELAAASGNLETVRTLLQLHLSITPEKRVHRLNSALMRVVTASSKAIADEDRLAEFTSLIRFLVQEGADINFFNPIQFSPLFIAIKDSNISMIDTLVQLGADIHRKNFLGESAIHFAVTKPAEMYKIIVTKSLLQHGAQVDQQNGKLQTALHFAINDHNAGLVNLLLTYNASLFIKDEDGQSPIDYAKKSSNNFIKNLIHEKLNFVRIKDRSLNNLNYSAPSPMSLD